MNYILTPIKHIDGLTIGKHYKISEYSLFNINHNEPGCHAVANDNGKIFVFGLYDPRIIVTPETDEFHYKLYMTESEFKEIVNEIRERCFEVEAGEYYCDKCLEFDDVLEVLNKKIKKALNMLF